MNKEVDLPKIIFLAGPDAVAKRRFAAELADIRADVMVLGFAEPLRGAVIGTFFQCDPLIDFQNPKLTLPGIEAQNYETFQYNYWRWLSDTYGKGVLGRIMIPRLKDNEAIGYDSFVFEDADLQFLEDMEVLARVIGPQECLMVRFAEGKAFFPPQGVPTVELLKNSTPEDFLTSYEALIGASA